MYLLKGFKNSPKDGHDYESVEDQKDLRIPIQNEDAFKHGIIYKAKYIGTQEITRPSSRVEIVSAMRRIRYEYKYRNIKKRKVNMEISVEGIKVSLSKKKKSAEQEGLDGGQSYVMCYPINRVFYVSHDSQDLLIFSYIARGEDGIFRCSVFKSFKKSQAMNIVRTIGQAFEVCHKMNADKASDEKEPERSNEEAATPNQESQDKGETDIDEVGESEIDQMTTSEETKTKTQDNSSTLVTDIDTAVEGGGMQKIQSSEILNGEVPIDGNIPQLHGFYIQQLWHQKYEADAAKAEVIMLKQQLKIENEARIHSQNRIGQLLAQNRDLLVTIQKLMHQVQSNTSAKDIFDPIDESWMTSSFPFTDSYFSRVAQSKPLSNDVTSECISSVYDNVHHQSLSLEGPEFPENKKNTANDSASLTKELFQNNKVPNFPESFEKDAVILSESVGERKGGISRSFTDLSKIGLEENKTDINHNANRITKFAIEAKDADDALDHSIAQKSIEQSVLSKEMMETFSDELNELDDNKAFKTSVTEL